MQCPACNREADENAFGNPAKCPECGVFYEKALALKRRREQAEASAASLQPQSQRKAKSVLAEMLDSVREGRERRHTEERQVAAAQALHVARPVVIKDIDVPFSSMVRLLVKLAIAAFPAAIIVGIIAWGAVSIFSLVTVSSP